MRRMATVIAVVAASATARAEVSASRADHALARSAVRALEAARAQCHARGPKLRAMVANVFDPSGFGRAVITHWTRLSADQRVAFDALADDVVGGQERDRAANMLCSPGARVENAFAQESGEVFIDLYRPEIEDCTQLVFSRDPAGAWRYDGEFYCGVDIFDDEWRARLGGGDYATAMARLRMLTTRAGSPR